MEAFHVQVLVVTEYYCCPIRSDVADLKIYIAENVIAFKLPWLHHIALPTDVVEGTNMYCRLA